MQPALSFLFRDVSSPVARLRDTTVNLQAKSQNQAKFHDRTMNLTLWLYKFMVLSREQESSSRFLRNEFSVLSRKGSSRFYHRNRGQLHGSFVEFGWF